MIQENVENFVHYLVKSLLPALEQILFNKLSFVLGVYAEHDPTIFTKKAIICDNVIKIFNDINLRSVTTSWQDSLN